MENDDAAPLAGVADRRWDGVAVADWLRRAASGRQSPLAGGRDL